MGALLKILFLFLISAKSHGPELKEFEAFLEDKLKHGNLDLKFIDYNKMSCTRIIICVG